MSVSNRRTKVLALMLLLLWVGAAMANDVRLSSYPTMSVADGRSTVTISAEVRDRGGNIVPDGTRVVFTTDRGHFRESVVETRNGVARSILVADSIPGVAKIVASAIQFQATASLDYEFVADRSLLSSAREYVEVLAPDDLMYSVDRRVIGASGPGQKVILIYKDIEIHADDLQFNVPNYEVRAVRARVKIGRTVDQQFGELYFKLNQRRGYGTTTYIETPLSMQPYDKGFVFIEGEERETYGMAEVSAAGIKRPEDIVPRSYFTFVEIGESTSLVAAKKAVAYPRKEIHFHKAEVYMGGSRIMRMPLFQVSLYNNSPIITDQMINVNDNQLAVNYPHYLSLKPGMTSLLRLQMGQNYGRGIGGSRGIFLNYEMNWSKGDDMQGDLTFHGLGRKDWGVGLRQYWRLDDTSHVTAQVEMPANTSLFGTVGLSKQFRGFSMSMNATDSRSLRGPASQSQQLAFTAQSDPVGVGNLPLRFTYGFQANNSVTRSEFFGGRQSTMGLNARATTLPLRLGQDTTLNAWLSVGKMYGHNAAQGLTTIGSANVIRTFNFGQADGSLMVTYDYVNDGFNSMFTGKQQLSGRAYFSSNNMFFSGFAVKGLDTDRLSYQMDASYKLSSLWRLSYAYTYEKYFGDSFMDYNFILSYRLGFRDIGLTWSHRTRRFGIQVLGTSFN
jgi:hypothetical protein